MCPTAREAAPPSAPSPTAHTVVHPVARASWLESANWKSATNVPTSTVSTDAARRECMASSEPGDNPGLNKQRHSPDQHPCSRAGARGRGGPTMGMTYSADAAYAEQP